MNLSVASAVTTVKSSTVPVSTSKLVEFTFVLLTVVMSPVVASMSTDVKSSIVPVSTSKLVEFTSVELTVVALTVAIPPVVIVALV